MPVPSAWIDSATFSDGKRVSFGRDDIVVIVGSNNSGKTEVLRGIEQRLRQSWGPAPVVTALTIKREGTEEALLAWLEANSVKVPSGTNDVMYSQGDDCKVLRNSAKLYWRPTEAHLADLAGFFCFRLSADRRLAASDPPRSISLTSEPLAHPIHHLQADDRLEAKISTVFRRVFGMDLIVHRNAGSKVPIHCGQRPIMPPGKDRVSFEYLQGLQELPAVHRQGDGIRAFVGVLLYALTVHYSMLLIDEPEAFLHPPQIRQLAHALARETPADRQMFIATHSGDFVRAMVEADQGRVRILRLHREQNTNHVRLLDNDQIRNLWSDPLLRHSNVLDGLFHEMTIVAEGDADCRFYSAIKDICDKDVRTPQDVLFVPCGGKARVKTVVRALKALAVPVRVICDFDVVSDEHPLRDIYEDLGGRWDQIQKDWRLVKESVGGRQAELPADRVKADIEQVLSDIKGKEFPKSATREIETILRKASPWAMAKQVGVPFIPPGDAAQAFARLDSALKNVGCYIVPVGELEGFDRTVGNHGPKWVSSVLEKDLAGADLEAARKFVALVVS